MYVGHGGLLTRIQHSFVFCFLVKLPYPSLMRAKFLLQKPIWAADNGGKTHFFLDEILS